MKGTSSSFTSNRIKSGYSVPDLLVLFAVASTSILKRCGAGGGANPTNRSDEHYTAKTACWDDVRSQLDQVWDNAMDVDLRDYME
jgi:hypothetical protein